MRNGLVYRKRSDKVLFLVPRAMKQDLLYKYHVTLIISERDKTVALLQESYWSQKWRLKSTRRNYKKLYDMYCFFEDVGQERRFHA